MRLKLVEVVIDEIPNYEQIASKVKELHDQEVELTKIAEMFGVTWLTAKAALRFAESGERPKPQIRKAKEPGEKRQPLYQELAPIVAKMHDEDDLKFNQITERLNQQGIQLKVRVVTKAYKYFHREAIANGDESNLRKCPRLNAETKQEIQQLLLAGGVSADQLAERFGSGKSTIYRLQRELNSTDSGAPAQESGEQRRSA